MLALMSYAQRVLVVDDQDSMRQLLCSALRGLGYTQIVTATDGASALTMLRGRMIDAMLLDVEMPGMGGLECLRTLRGDPEIAHTPVVMVTGRASESLINAIRPLVVAGYLIKPVTATALQAALARIWSKN